jgi:hypothetical protein
LDTRKIVKVFLASPGDLVSERRIAKAVIDEHNTLWAEYFGYQVELIGWEDATAGFGRPQEIINRDLEQCELFIGAIWKHWGTPTGKYGSGFEEEFSISIARRENEGLPEISLLLKDIEADSLRDPGESLKKVLSFREQIINEKKVYYETFSDLKAFEERVRRCVSTFIRRLKENEKREVSDESQTRPKERTSSKQIEAPNTATASGFSMEGATFLRSIAEKIQTGKDEHRPAAPEVARLLLIGSIIRTGGNDEKALGVHDTNLLFRHFRHSGLGRRERMGLVSCGLEHYAHENAPLWHWYASVDGFTRSLLSLYNFSGPLADVGIGALLAMRVLSEPLITAPIADRDVYFKDWFSERSVSAMKVAALKYLGDCGITSDLSAVIQEIERNDTQTRSAAVEAAIRINLRYSREKAVVALHELQPVSIHESLLSALFSNPGALDTELISKGVAHKNEKVRRVTADLLLKRRALTPEIADQLTTDSDGEVRLIALNALISHGRVFSSGEMRNIIVKPVMPGLGIAYAYSDTVGEACWKRFEMSRLEAMNDTELRAARANVTVYDMLPEFVFQARHFRRLGDELRRDVEDQYKSKFDLLVEKFASYGDTYEKTKSLDEYLRQHMTRAGLDAVCQGAKPEDLGLIRRSLRKGFVNCSDCDVEYLRKFGEWEDIPLIIDAIDRPARGVNPLLYWSDNRSSTRVASRAIQEIGRGRLPEILALQMGGELLSQIVYGVANKEFSALSDASILSLLVSDSDIVRKIAALKCIVALSKGRVSKLLEDYVSADGPRFYNVVHWLDLGASAPRDRAAQAAGKLLREWQER